MSVSVDSLPRELIGEISNFFEKSIEVFHVFRVNKAFYNLFFDVISKKENGHLSFCENTVFTFSRERILRFLIEKEKFGKQKFFFVRDVEMKAKNNYHQNKVTEQQMCDIFRFFPKIRKVEIHRDFFDFKSDIFEQLKNVEILQVVLWSGHTLQIRDILSNNKLPRLKEFKQTYSGDFNVEYDKNNLKNLRKLEIYHCNATENGLNGLPINLKYLCLYHIGSITGNFLKRLGGLEELKVVNCESFDDSCFVNLKSLKFLKVKNLGKFTGRSLKFLTKLRKLKITNCGGMKSESFYSMPKDVLSNLDLCLKDYEHFYLDNFYVNDKLMIDCLSKVTKFRIKFVFPSPEYDRSLYHLMDKVYTYLSGKGLGSFKNVKELDLNIPVDNFPLCEKWVENLKRVEKLRFKEMVLSDDDFTDLHHLKELYLSSCYDFGKLLRGKFLFHLLGLTKLTLKHLRLRLDVKLNKFKLMHKLRVLVLEDVAGIVDSDFNSLGVLKHLKLRKMSGISDEFCKPLSNLRSLSILDSFTPKITQTFFLFLKNLKRLYKIRLCERRGYEYLEDGLEHTKRLSFYDRYQTTSVKRRFFCEGGDCCKLFLCQECSYLDSLSNKCQSCGKRICPVCLKHQSIKNGSKVLAKFQCSACKRFMYNGACCHSCMENLEEIKCKNCSY